jgi:hypothetical protein
MRWPLGIVCVVLCCPIASWAQGTLCHPTLAPRAAPPQIADTDFSPPLPSPAFAAGQGHSVFLDEAHNNFHTVDGRYGPFVKILRRDGFVVEPMRSRFSSASLMPAQINVPVRPSRPPTEES